MNRNTALILILFLFLSPQIMADEEETLLSWPREMEIEDVVITLYQPQFESFKNNILSGRMALSAKPKDKEILFGALWFDATMETDLEERLVLLVSMDISKVHFPGLEDKEAIERFRKILEKDLEDKDLEMSLDRLLAGLEVAEDIKTRDENFNNAPPAIHFRNNPTILIYIDGEPKLKDTEEKGYQYVVNTPFFIVKEVKKDRYFIKGAKWWYTSPEIKSGWESTSKVPGKVKKLADNVLEEVDENDSLLMAMNEPPELIVATGPAELLIVDGEPDYAPIGETSLLYVKNTESDIIMDINTQDYYVLLAGRWYASKSLADGSWKFIEPGDLPEDFSKIPEEGDMSNVRSSVPGTEEAKTALLEQTVPQTATVDRNTATVRVTYDGNPKFERIEGTDVAYAVNCDKTVLLINDMYYCVDDGIWFESSKATGAI